MNRVDKDHRMKVPASVDHLAYCKSKYLYVPFSDTVMLVPASLVERSLIHVVELVYLFHMCWSLKSLNCGILWSWFHDSSFTSGSVSVLLCIEALGISSSLDGNGAVVQVGF